MKKLKQSDLAHPWRNAFRIFVFLAELRRMIGSRQERSWNNSAPFKSNGWSKAEY